MKPTSPSDFEPVRQWIKENLTREGVPSLSVGVAQHGKIIWEEGFGWADCERRIPATAHTSYSVASVSKPIAATALMKLVEAGKIDLDRPVDDYLPNGTRLNTWIGDPAQATVRRLASHTLGLPLHSNGFKGHDIPLKPAMEESIRRYGNIITPPGERYRYANFGYGIIGYLVGRISGLEFSDYLRQEIFRPLGMNRSYLEALPGHMESTATFYDQDRRPLEPSVCDHDGASMVCASVHDLLRFGLFHAGTHLPDQQPVLSRQTLDAMHAPEVRMVKVPPSDLNLRPESSYGLGWVVDDDEIDFRISHGGGMGGAAAKLLFLPREEIVIATGSNLFHPLAYTVEREILSVFAPEYREKFRAFDERKRRKAEAGCAPGEGLAAAGLTGQWSGVVETYERTLPFHLEFQTDGTVHAKLSDQLTVLVNQPRLEGGRFTGTMAGTVETGDALRHPRHPFHHLQLDLQLRDRALNGGMISVAGCSLGHWAHLEPATNEG